MTASAQLILPEPDAWNPVYLEYCAAHGKTPEEMLAHDIQRWPGGKMAGFIIWAGRRAQERGERR